MSKNKGDDSEDYLKPKGLSGKTLLNKQRYSWPPTFPAVGSFDDLENDDSRMVLEVGESCFSGLRCTLINLLERNYKFRVSHSFELGRKEERLVNGQKDGRRGQYTLGTHLNYNNFKIQLAKSGKQRGEIFVDYNHQENLFNSSFHVGMTPLKTDADASFNFVLNDMNVEAKFANYNKSEKYPKTKISKPEHAFSIGFTQPATENIAVGTQISFVPYADKAQLKLIGRHVDILTNSKATLGFSTGTMATDKIQATYSQELTKNVNVVAATELSYAPQVGVARNDYEWKSVSKLGYCLNGAGVVVTGVVDTDSAVNMVMNTYMGPDFVITLSANCNYYKRKYDAGFGIQFPF